MKSRGRRASRSPPSPRRCRPRATPSSNGRCRSSNGWPARCTRRRAAKAMAAAIEVVGGAVQMGGRTIWSDVDVAVTEGEFVAILGPNGAGKSTLLNVLLGLEHLFEGSVAVLGGPAGANNERIGYLPQRR